jgi:hypothetical protein
MTTCEHEARMSTTDVGSLPVVRMLPFGLSA